MKNLDQYFSVKDFEKKARRRLPNCVYEFIRGGAEDEASLAMNRHAFDDYAFIPRGLVDVSKRSQAITLWDRQYDSPVGIAPTGLTSIVSYQADRALARQAVQDKIPYIISGASNVALETLQEDNQDCWYQGYFPSNRTRIQAIMDRIERAGIRVLVVTIDTSVGANRENNARRGFSVPLKLRPSLLLDGALHPHWATQVFMRTLLTSGIPRFANFYETIGSPITEDAPHGMRTDRDSLSWDDIEWIRANWKHRFVLKGVLHPADAERAVKAGLDAIIVSNHGGRQLDGSISPMRALPQVIASVPAGFPVIVDGGFRRGSDVLKAIALGARMTLIGRPILYGAAVAGQQGIARVIDIFRSEIDRNLALLGCTDINALSRDQLAFRQAAGQA